MILNKGKPYFWSQLLFSMIAIFSLPDVQAVKEVRAEIYANQSRQVEHRSIVQLIRAIQPQALSQSKPLKIRKISIFHKFEPLFFNCALSLCSPIRAGPKLF